MTEREAHFTRKHVGGFGVGFQITCIHASHMFHERLQLAAEALSSKKIFQKIEVLNFFDVLAAG